MNKTSRNKSYKIKEPISNEMVYRVTLVLVSVLSGFFFLKNVAAKNKAAMIVIGVTLAVFAVLQIIMNILKNKTIKYASVSVAMLLTIAFISLFSGEAFSDDFSLFLAAIGLGGMYFKKSFPIVQLILSDILLIVMSTLQPEKAGDMGQFRLCFITFNVAAIVLCIVIQRGYAFIEKSNKRAEEVERVIASLAEMNMELNNNFETAEERMNYLQKANIHMEKHTKELKQDSKDITSGVDMTLSTCNDAKDKIDQTKNNIKFLDYGVKLFEQTLKDNEANMEDMVNNFTLVKKSSEDISRVFEDIQEQSRLIAGVMKQLKNIASSTTMLSINASIEAVRAGESGKGFAVVAGQIKDLAIESNNFSDEVEKIVTEMCEKVESSVINIEESVADTDKSLESLSQLKESFSILTDSFESIYYNIEEESDSISEVECSFEEIENNIVKVNDMTKRNQTCVEQITKIASLYADNMMKMKSDTGKLKRLAESMESELVNS